MGHCIKIATANVEDFTFTNVFSMGNHFKGKTLSGFLNKTDLGVKPSEL